MKIITYGGSRKFLNMLDILSKGCRTECEGLGEAILLAEAEGADTLFLMPRYDRGERTIGELSDCETEALCRVIKAGVTKLYIEMYPAYDYRDCFVLGLQARSRENSIGRYTLTLSDDYRERLGFEILQKRSGLYFPAEPHTDEKKEVLVEIKNCFGIHKIAMAEERREGVALARTNGRVYSAMADLSHLSDYDIHPYAHWSAFWGLLLTELVGCSREEAEAAFKATHKANKMSRESRPVSRKEALRSAVCRAVDWHKSSGILIDGGKGGVYEMIRSFDLGIARNARGDSGMITAALFSAAGKYFGREDYLKVAEDIANNLLNERCLQIEDGENKGLIKWFSDISGLGPHSVYVSDSSRVANALLALYKTTDNKEYLRRAVTVGDGILRWFGGEALFPGCNMNYDKDTLSSIQSRERNSIPEFYDAPIMLLGNLYSETGDPRYREQVIRTASYLAEIYPNYSAVASHSENFTLSRLLGVLSVAQRFGDGVWTEIINKLLIYFKNHRHKSGGFFEGRAYFDEKSLSRDMEFAVGFDQFGEHIADTVYCQNSLAAALNLLSSCAGSFDRELAEELRCGLIDFLLDTQILSEDKRFDGAWMRAVDMDLFEYYGCDKDFAWGPYSILTGWVTGTVPLIFLDLLGVKTIY